MVKATLKLGGKKKLTHSKEFFLFVQNLGDFPAKLKQELICCIFLKQQTSKLCIYFFKMGNGWSSTGNEQPTWIWQQMSGWIPGLSAWDTKNDQNDDQKDEQEDKKDNDQFQPVKMSTLYNSNEGEFPVVTIKEFGQTFYQFVSRRGDKVDKELTLHDCYLIGGMLSNRKGKHAGLIETECLGEENFVWPVQMVRNYRADSPQITIDKKDQTYSWLRKNQVLINYRTKREYLVLKEDDSFYYT